MRRVTTRRYFASRALLLAAVGLAIAASKHAIHHQDSGASMGFGKDKVMCSQFSALLLDPRGQPMAGVRVERSWTWAWSGETESDETVSDDRGRFRFPRVTRSNFLSGIVPHEPVIKQEIKAYGPSGTVILWGHSKHNYEDNGELGGRPVNVVCGIDKAPPGEVLYYGTCVEAK